METRKTIKGILKDQTGQPVSDAVVMIVNGTADFNEIASVSNDNGEFFISNIVVPGKYVLQINGSGQEMKKEINVSEQDTTININF